MEEMLRTLAVGAQVSVLEFLDKEVYVREREIHTVLERMHRDGSASTDPNYYSQLTGQRDAYITIANTLRKINSEIQRGRVID